MFDAETYLRAIGHTGAVAPDLPTLRALHRRHAEAIPYRSDPQDPLMNKAISTWDWDEVFRRSIVDGRGGNCFEVNETFGRLLWSIGFEVDRLSASSLLPDGRYGPEIEHQALLVKLDGESYLVDVGFGQPTSVDPLPVESAAQGSFRVVTSGEWHSYERRSKDKWIPVYRFKLVHRSLDDWDFQSEEFVNLANDIPVARLRVISRVVDGSTLTLSGKRFWKHNADEETFRMILDRAEFEDLTRLILNEN
ncbi:arylamine N-acetyltransferase [Lentzea tibetensis]|uniref:Arylamine N-acetyltransferase n=1 Tax=Lentzea tibetensis TaxID=2591470 RepID=A0A563EIP1_9PSEU|nr:arylamine N-acetyltransferase [Lentzea tibetensis]TWP46683.1 arylamine N-acetyltransferase [Lentzea tibetensis]